MQAGNAARQPIPAPEPLTERFNKQRVMAPQMGESPVLPTPFASDSSPQPAMPTRAAIRLPATPATPGTPRTVAVSPLDFPLGE